MSTEAKISSITGEPGVAWIKAAPHRMFFFFGTLLLLLGSAWWAVVLLLRPVGLALPAAVAPSWVHAVAMLYTFLPMYMFGFLFTAGPAWLAVKGPTAPALLHAALLAFVASAALIPLAAVSMSASGVAALAFCAAWTRYLLIFWRMIRSSGAPDRRHASLVLACMLPGVLGLAAYAMLCFGANPSWFQKIGIAGLWWFAIPVFLVVAHRMLPFFTASAIPALTAWRPYWILWVFLAASFGHGALEFAGAARYAWTLDFPAAVFLLWLGLRWGLAQSLSLRLLAMLHVGFVWLGLAFALYSLDAALNTAGVRSLGLAPLHAVTMGFLGSTLFAMLTRVTRGHSGRTLTADNTTWRLFWLLQLAVLFRLGAEVWLPTHTWMLNAASLAWLAAFASWSWKYLPIYLHARADGKPG